ncbi:MAG TPA: GlsB/YeaQ/YmgE family stress response membrane protein, partial [Armatimonadota bacterium]|nr:GlsB/YeaQ/YmgE family stress response membrane protein [Armatimonadota bacterium]
EEPGGLLADLLVGILGAVVGGWIFNAIGIGGVTGFNLWSILVATIGAALLLFIYHAVTGRRTA